MEPTFYFLYIPTKHLTYYYLTLWRGLIVIEIDSFVENENKKDQCLPILHCTALLGIVPVAVGLYSSRNKHTASLHYLAEDTGTYICKLPPNKQRKVYRIRPFPPSYSQGSYSLLCDCFFGEVASLRRRGWGLGVHVLDFCRQTGCSICIKVETS